jgi:hypothetical protein
VPSAAKTATFSTADIQTDLNSLLLLVNVTAISGTPSMTITLEAKDEDGAYFALYTSAAISTVSKLAASIGAALLTNTLLSSVFRLTFTISGGTPSLTFTVGVYGV